MNADQKLVYFAGRMNKIPTKAIHCDVYEGVVYRVVDERHARNIFRKVAPSASFAAIGEAVRTLHLRLEYEAR